MSKSDFDNNLTSFNKQITSNKTKHLEVLITKGYKFFLDRIYFTSNDGAQNTFICQQKLDTL